MLFNKKILVAITGSIAAYKSAELIRLLKKDGAEVRVIMTEAAKEFITPLTIQAVSGHEIHDQLLDPKAESGMGHIQLAKWADLVVIAPCSANTMSNIVNGKAQNLLCSVLLATKAKVLIAPAMNQSMWNSIFTQNNKDILYDAGYRILGPAEGSQACGDVGLGRMIEPNDIATAICSQFSNLFEGKKFLITAGPTVEKIDPVRYLTNRSSGKMGFALAETANDMGADVHLISGPVNLNISNHINRINVETAQEMFDEVLKIIDQCDVFIGCAAVADYKPTNILVNKIKKTQESISLELTKNIDIIDYVAKHYPSKYVVGFSAETNELKKHAMEKLSRKNLDLIVANDVSRKDIAFDSSENEVTIFSKGSTISIPKSTKMIVATRILKEIFNQNSYLH